MKLKTVLTIAGSDSSGGAGIQADIKAITMNGVYASSVITALTAQNTTGVYGIQETPADFIAAQMDAVFSDIFPDAVKIGMLPSPDAMKCVASRLRQYKPATCPGSRHGIYQRTSSYGSGGRDHSQGGALSSGRTDHTEYSGGRGSDRSSHNG